MPHIHKEFALLIGGGLGIWAFFAISQPLYHRPLPQWQPCIFKQPQQSAQLQHTLANIQNLGLMLAPDKKACPVTTTPPALVV